MKIKLATPEIQCDSIVDGEGIRSVIWTQGCLHNCPGCHNPETHSFKAGYLVDVEDIKNQISDLVGQDGITFSGGDPMEQAEACAEIAKYCKQLELNVWCYTGYTFEELLEKSQFFPKIRDFLENIDILIDGKFKQEEKSYEVLFRGSRNQRIIDVPKSLNSNKAIIVKKYDNSEVSKRGRNNNHIYV